MKTNLTTLLVLSSTNAYALCLTPSTTCNFNEDYTSCQLRLNAERSSYEACQIRDQINQMQRNQRHFQSHGCQYPYTICIN